MTRFDADWFDGRTSRAHRVTVTLAGDVKTGSSLTGVMLTAIALASGDAMTPSVMVKAMLVLASRCCGGL